MKTDEVYGTAATFDNLDDAFDKYNQGNEEMRVNFFYFTHDDMKNLNAGKICLYPINGEVWVFTRVTNFNEMQSAWKRYNEG